MIYPDTGTFRDELELAREILKDQKEKNHSLM